MAEEDDSQKTEDPTDRKLSKGREEGQVAQSQEIKSWIVLLGGTAGIIFLVPYIADGIGQQGKAFISKSHEIPVDMFHLRDLTSDVLIEAGLLVAPFMLMIVVLCLLANLGQFGLIFAPKKIAPDYKKIDPIKGTKRVLSSQSVMEFAKGMFKIVIVAALAFGLALPLLDDIQLMPFFTVEAALDRIHVVAILMGAASVAAMTAIAIADYLFQRNKFMKDMRMSKQEVKDEHKQTDGDPQVKAKIRQVRAERARQRMMQKVPDADVVITNPTHFAIALEYKMDSMPAPKVVGKGADHMAFRIRELAEKNEIPIVENPPLARALYSSVELDEEIPPEHFKAVAEVISYVFKLKGKLPH